MALPAGDVLTTHDLDQYFVRVARKAAPPPGPDDLHALCLRFGVQPLVTTLRAHVGGPPTGPRGVPVGSHSKLKQLVGLTTVASVEGVMPAEARRVAHLWRVYDDLMAWALHQWVADMAAAPGTRARVAAAVQAWALHRVVTEWLALLFSRVDPGQPDVAFQLAPVGKCVRALAERTCMPPASRPGCRAKARPAAHVDPHDCLPAARTPHGAVAANAVWPDVFVSLVSVAHRGFQAQVYGPWAGALVAALPELVAAVRQGREDPGFVHQAVRLALAMQAPVPCTLRNDKDTEVRLVQGAWDAQASAGDFLACVEGTLVPQAREWYKAMAAARLRLASQDGVEFLMGVVEVFRQEDGVYRAYLPDATRLRLLHVLRDAFVNDPDLWTAPSLRDRLEDLMCQTHAVVVAQGGHGFLAAAETLQDPKWRPLEVLRAVCGVVMGTGADTSYPQGLAVLRDTLRAFVHHAGGRAWHGDPAGGGGAEGAEGPPARAALRRDTAAVGAVLQLVRATKVMVEVGLCGRADMRAAANDALMQVCSAHEDMPEALAWYADSALRGRLGRLGDKDLAEVLEGVVTCVAWVPNKDLFREHYNVLLHTRLLAAKSVSDDAEVAMLQMLKARFGVAFTARAEAMLADLRVAEEAAARYAGDAPAGPVQCLPRVLKAAVWPAMHDLPDTLLPREMVRCAAVFTAHYAATPAGASRVLTWVHGAGTAEVMLHTSTPPILAVCSTLQAAVLLSLGAAGPEGMPVHVLGANLGLEAGLLRNVLGSMVLVPAHLQAVAKTPPGKPLGADHVVALNPRWHSPARRVVLPTVVLPDRTDVAGVVTAEQAYVMDAVVMRTMKSRRTLDHAALLQAVVHQCTTFRPDSRALKARVADLMRRGYLTRQDPTSHTAPYVYVAGTGDT
jgi:hypothetical protein